MLSTQGQTSGGDVTAAYTPDYASSNTVAMSSANRQKPPKLNVDEYLTTAISATPSELHPFFETFKTLHSRK